MLHLLNTKIYTKNLSIMADAKRVAEKIKQQGYVVVKHEMEDESPERWFIFQVWFYLQHDFEIRLDWRCGKYYLYVERGEVAIREKMPARRALDAYTAEEFLRGNLLKHYPLFGEISETIRTTGLYVTEEKKVINILKREDYRAVLFWLMDEWGSEPCDNLCGIVHKEQPLMMLSTFRQRDLMIEQAKQLGYEITTRRPSWADEEDDERTEQVVIGFKELDFLF